MYANSGDDCDVCGFMFMFDCSINCRNVFGPGLPDFSWYNIPKRVKLITRYKKYRMAAKHTKWPQNIPNGNKIYQMDTKYTKWQLNRAIGHKIYLHLPVQKPPKFTQIEIFCFKICHPATPVWTTQSVDHSQKSRVCKRFAQNLLVSNRNF
jgi:hypothetical protein